MGLLDNHNVDRVRQPGEICPKCNKGILESKKGKFGAFLGCNQWPDCSFTENKGVNLQKLASDLLKSKGKTKKRRRSKKTSVAKKKAARKKKQQHLAEKKQRRWRKQVESALKEHQDRFRYLIGDN